MSDNEHRQPDTRTSGTYSQQADAIRMNGYIMLRNRPCKITGIDKFRIGKHGHAKYKFMATGIFTGDEFEDIVPSSHNCDVPNVTVYDYQLINISSEDGFVSLLIENNITKDDIKLPTDERLLHQIKDRFAEGHKLVVTVVSAMGEEQIRAVKYDLGPK